MDKNITFGKWGAICLLVNMINMQIFISFPRLITETGGTASWIISIYLMLLALIGFWLMSKLFRKFPGKDLLDIGQEVGGKVLYILIGLYFGIAGFLIEAITLREFAETLKVVSFVATPLSFILIFIIFAFIFSAFFGVEPIIRILSIGVPIIAVLYLVILLALTPRFQVSNLLPIMGNGAYKVFGEGIFRLSFYSGLTILFFLPPFIKSFKKFKSSVYTAIIFSGIFMTAGTLTYIAIIPFPSSLEPTVPIYNLARLIHYGKFFQRVEPLFLIMWSFAAYMYFSSGLFFAIYSLKKALSLPYLRPLIIPCSIIIFNLAFLPKSFMSAVEIENTLTRTYSFIPIFGIPILLLIIASIRRKGVQKETS
ncbi:MAG: GerAB/ArcD/ProY family transporter [Ignavibacteriales bacterium]